MNPGKSTLHLYGRSNSLVSTKGFNRRIAVDFDGCCAPTGEDFNIIGEPLPGAIQVLSNLRELGYYVVIWSGRVDTIIGWEIYKEHGNLMSSMLLWLEEWDFPYDEIFLGPSKPPCHYFVDDKAFSFIETASETCWQSIFDAILKYRGKEWK
jgi:hypothetical protein